MRQIEGQMSIFDYLKERETVYPVEIMGLCDDAYCPQCGEPLDEFKWMDSEICPYCKCKISWSPWHLHNDEMNRELFGEKWRDRFGKMLKKTKEQEQKT